MKPATLPLTIYQGQTFDDSFVFENAAGDREDFSGMHARMQIRPFIASPLVIAELTTDNGYISQLDETGTIQFAYPAALTSTISLSHEWETWWYDLELYNDDESNVQRLMQGVVVVSPETTR